MMNVLGHLFSPIPFGKGPGEGQTAGKKKPSEEGLRLLKSFWREKNYQTAY